MAKLSLAAAGMLAATFSSAQGSYGTETISDPYGNTVTVGPILDTVSAYDYGRSLGVREDILDMTDCTGLRDSYVIPPHQNMAYLK